MKKKLLYLTPQVDFHRLSLDKSFMTVSDTDFSGNIDDGIEEIWNFAPGAPGMFDIL